MSKKHKHTNNSQNLSSPVLNHAAEYRIIKHDLLKVILFNAIYLAAVLAIYFTNLKTGYLEHWFSKVL